MPKLPECVSEACRRLRCLLYAHNPHIICAIHPYGPDDMNCLDFRPDPDAEPEEKWEPEGATYYNGELIVQPLQRWTREEQLELLDTHPFFTGVCPSCGYRFPLDNLPDVHWDCPSCRWVDDSV
jgi:hypothetical protein